MSGVTDLVAVIRPATAADLPTCATIINDYLGTTPWMPRVHSREVISAMFTPDTLETRPLLVAGPPGGVIGYLSLLPNGFLPALFLVPPARGRGLGKRLLDQAKALHPAFLELTVFAPNLAAQAFYRREGFVDDSGRYDANTEEGVPTLLFRWEGKL